jgi:hypothetical protein
VARVRTSDLQNPAITKNARQVLVSSSRETNGIGLSEDPERVIKAVREQLGLELKRERRTLRVLEVQRVIGE